MSRTRATKDKAFSKSIYHAANYMKTEDPLFGWDSNRQATGHP